MMLFGLCFAVYVPSALTSPGRKSDAGRRGFRPNLSKAGLGVAGLVFAVFLYVNLTDSLARIFSPSFGSWLDLSTPSCGEQKEGPCYPLGAVSYIKEHGLSGNILAHYQWGAYITWTCWPDCLVAVDGRCQTLYSEDVLRDYLDFLYGKISGRTFLSAYRHDMILVPPHTRVYHALTTKYRWHPVYEDAQSALLLPDGPFVKRR